jgi:O-succinylbenzoic acid--CoA ligase
LVTLTITIPIMHKDITFLDDVTEATRQKVLKFVKDWNSEDKWTEVNTSGSTGTPKTIKLSKKHIKASANATVSFFKLEANQSILLALSTDYIAGKMMLVRALEHHLKIIVAPLKSNPLDLRLEQPIHFSAFVPLQVQTILDNKRSRANYESISNVIIGGAVINDNLEAELQTLPNKNYATFGMTETISHIALRNITKKEEHYTAMPQVDFSINEKNCLVINAPLVCGEILETTDCVELISTKQFIWKGRADFVINSGGIKLHPEEIEKKIKPLLSSNQFYLIGEDDNVLGQKLILKIESSDSLDLTILQQQLKTVLTKYEIPKEIQLVPSFKMTDTGKIIRE